MAVGPSISIKSVISKSVLKGFYSTSLFDAFPFAAAAPNFPVVVPPGAVVVFNVVLFLSPPSFDLAVAPAFAVLSGEADY